MNRVSLSKAEARWFSKNVLSTLRILEAASKKDPEILNRTTYKTLNSLRDRATEMQTILTQLSDDSYEVDLILGRKHKLIIGEMIAKTIKSLTEVILPEYTRRGEKYDSYRLDTEEKIKLLKTFIRKFR